MQLIDLCKDYKICREPASISADLLIQALRAYTVKSRKVRIEQHVPAFIPP